MWCLISQANSVVFEVRADPKAIGQECLEKVCEIVNVRYESDYFGLKYINHKKEETWLNLRNPIDKQVNCSHVHNAPYVRLSLRVKFWVPPHILQTESTRHQFYLNGRLELLEKRLLAPDWESISRLIAFIAQAECGDFNELDPARTIYNLAALITPADQSERPNNLLQTIVFKHKQLKGMKSASAEYWFLKEISEFENFGEETFTMKTLDNTTFGVGPHGITIYKKDTEKKLISFTNITSASSHKRTFKLEYLTVDNEEAVLNIKLDSSHLAGSLYRAITEKHAFYSCETVRSAVTSQFIRDLKGTIVSIFNEDSTLGKKYVFDIKRTCREVYDNARRALYLENATQMITNENLDHNHNGDECKNSQEKLSRFLDAMTCKICMDRQIDSIFLPCGHGVACTACALRCDRCPLCRCDIEQAQRVFLPVELQQLISPVNND